MFSTVWLAAILVRRTVPTLVTTFQYSTQLLQLPLHAAHYRAPLQPGDSQQRCGRHSDRIRN